MNNRTEEKLDRVLEQVSSINATLAKQEQQLTEHIRRTGLLEEAVKPIQKHVSMVEGAAKLLTLFGVLLAVLRYFVKLG